MFNYTDVLRRYVGMQLRKYRKKKGLLQNSFETIGIDGKTISHLENGKIKNNKKNFISEYHINKITKHLGITAEQLFWGEQEDKENLVKLIMVALIINDSSINPFIPHMGLDKFFNNADYHKLYSVLTENTNVKTPKKDIYNNLSEVLREQLLFTYNISTEAQQKFYSQLDNSTMKSIDHAKEIVDSFIKSNPKFAKHIKIEYPYEDFIAAFNIFWKHRRTEYISIFEKELFLSEEKLCRGEFNYINDGNIIFTKLLEKAKQHLSDVYMCIFPNLKKSFVFYQNLLEEILKQIQKNSAD